MKVRCIVLTLSSPHHDSDDSLGITGYYCLSHYVCLIFYEPKMYEHMVSNKINNKSLGEKLHSENSVNITSIYKITFKEEKYIWNSSQINPGVYLIESQSHKTNTDRISSNVFSSVNIKLTISLNATFLRWSLRPNEEGGLPVIWYLMTMGLIIGIRSYVFLYLWTLLHLR